MVTVGDGDSECTVEDSEGDGREERWEDGTVTAVTFQNWKKLKFIINILCVIFFFLLKFGKKHTK